MPLLKLKDLIVNTDHIIKAEYKGGGISGNLTIYLTDGGARSDASKAHMDSRIYLKDYDAGLMWSVLSQLAVPVVPAPAKQ
jgi:hypothetical protein